MGINVLSPSTTSSSTGYHPTDKTPSPTSTHMHAQSLQSPAGSMSITSMVSPTTPGSAGFVPRPHSMDVGSLGVAVGMGMGSDSRRESVDSRINQGFGEMRLGGSPYASHNHSTTSIQGTLAQQRNPRGGLDSLSIHRISNGYQPGADRTPDGHPKGVRTAPAITGPATSTIARAAEPTKGQAWAFPEEPGAPTLYDSRRSSITESIASSQFTTESRLPPGQRRLDDGLGSEYQRMSNVSADFPAVHHHTLQHKQLSDLHSEESSPHSAAQPYSRTPELRVSHKLAERKRRTEMKELFEQLRDLMPQERGSKASKWEILTKGTSLGASGYRRWTGTLTKKKPSPNTNACRTISNNSQTITILRPKSRTTCAARSKGYGWRTRSCGHCPASLQAKALPIIRCLRSLQPIRMRNRPHTMATRPSRNSRLSGLWAATCPPCRSRW